MGFLSYPTFVVEGTLSQGILSLNVLSQGVFDCRVRVMSYGEHLSQGITCVREVALLSVAQSFVLIILLRRRGFSGGGPCPQATRIACEVTDDGDTSWDSLRAAAEDPPFHAYDPIRSAAQSSTSSAEADALAVQSI